MSIFFNPSASVARGIENIILYGAKDHRIGVKVISFIFSRILSVTLFPTVLTFELLFKRLTKAAFSLVTKNPPNETGPTKFQRRCDKVSKFALAIPFTLLGLFYPDGIPGFFLKNAKSTDSIRPFGVEGIYGKTGQDIRVPNSVETAKEVVQEAIKDKKQISIRGAGMCEGQQTVPEQDKHIIIDTKLLNSVEIDIKNNCARVGAGATWEQIQIAANKLGKSVIVKQASDPFSVGGSIGINCHGWAHNKGAISSTVKSLTIINAQGEIQKLTPEHELFGCMFGTLGYFGLIVEAEIELTDNEQLIELSETIELDQFHDKYTNTIKGADIPLFGGRLSLDMRQGNPLRKIEMVQYVRDRDFTPTQSLVTKNFTPEPKKGTRIQRIGLKMIAHFSTSIVRHILGNFWKGEQKALQEQRRLTRNEALHPPINAFSMLHHSNLHAQWLQEYFIKPEKLASFLQFLGAQLKANDVKLINATIRPVPKDTVSVLPYAEQDRYAVVISFDQYKTPQAIEKTKKWIEDVNQYLVREEGIYYQAYMPYATREQFESCYGKERVENMRKLKTQYDPNNCFGNGHTAKYFDPIQEENLN